MQAPEGATVLRYALEHDRVQSVGDAVILSVPLDGLRSAESAQPSESAPAH